MLQLSHNYRSHAGVLRLAACVVELLYHFFGASLDRLPPDLGLFDGPKPVIMDVENTAELLLMLQGAKRETSRIEFGAHQVRNLLLLLFVQKQNKWAKRFHIRFVDIFAHMLSCVMVPHSILSLCSQGCHSPQ